MYRSLALVAVHRIVLTSTPAQLKQCHDIRIAVFISEQGFSYEDEFDTYVSPFHPLLTFASKDEGSDHFLLLDAADEPIGTIRFYAPLSKLGRLALLKPARGTGAGQKLVEHMIEHVRTRCGKAGNFSRVHKVAQVEIVANAQVYAKGFYEKCGFKVEGDEFDEVRPTTDDVQSESYRMLSERAGWPAPHSDGADDCSRRLRGAPHVEGRGML